MLQISWCKKLQTDLWLFFVLFEWCWLQVLTNSTLLQAHIVDIRTIPEALPYFLTPKTVEENSVLLQHLPHWAACSITQALEFLTPNYKGHPRVMAYVLRVLESYPPERVTFFMPQLVQSLRYDEGVSLKVKISRSLFLSMSFFFKSVFVYQSHNFQKPSLFFFSLGSQLYVFLIDLQKLWKFTYLQGLDVVWYILICYLIVVYSHWL